MVLEGGEGSWVWTAQGERYLDFASGIGVTNLGHRHPKVTAAVHAQVDKIWHAQVSIAHHGPMLELTGRLQKVMPPGSNLDTFLFVTSGSEAVEAAVKLARHATGRPNIIVFQGGYHGRTLLTHSMSTAKTIYRGGYGPHAAGIHVAPHPYYLGRTSHIEDPVAWTVQQLDLLLHQQTDPKETAALVIEPVLGEGGYVPHPPGLLKALRQFASKHEMLFIADEVQSGCGRTGRMFAVEHDCVAPDILVFAKGIASGLPLAGIASRKELMDTQPPGSQGGTYAGNAVACAAANATLQVLTQDGILENVQARGTQIIGALAGMQQDAVAPIKSVRGLGLMIALEFDDQIVPKGFANQVTKACLSRGMIIITTGTFETVRLAPPLTVSAEECCTAVGILREAVREVWAQSSAAGA